jgi:hypothetical protein
MIHSCGTTYGALLAVGKAKVRARGSNFYEDVSSELEIYGVTGGMMSHHMEAVQNTVLLLNVFSVVTTSISLDNSQVEGILSIRLSVSRAWMRTLGSAAEPFV